jgi:DNA (cytosine-5)-methyltransferase 1
MYKVISTFSGIGGSSQGYKQAGLQVLASVEFLDYQARNYRLNHPTTKVYQEDIRKLNPLDILRDLGLKPGELDILDGSPPCSSFSTNGIVEEGWGKSKAYGNRVQRTDDLFFEFIRFLQVIQPKVFVAENVSGLIKGTSKGHFNTFFDYFQKAGYRVKAKLMNAANYGVPQKRERVIFIGVRQDLPFEPVYPSPKSKIVSVQDALKGISVDIGENVKISDLSKKYWANTRPGSDFGVAAKALTGKAKRFSCKKLNPNDTANTITAASYSDIFHWAEARNLYTEELKALQSFPLDFKVIGNSRRDRCEGIGRAVPPLMMQAIAETIKEKILDRL